MSTRSMIAGIDSMGMIRGIYCHFDGHIDCVGKTLKESYNTPEKLADLIALGDIRSLEDTPEKTESYYRRGEDWEGVQPEDWDNSEDYCLTALSRGADYIYLFDMDTNIWRVTRDTVDNFKSF